MAQRLNVQQYINEVQGLRSSLESFGREMSKFSPTLRQQLEPKLYSLVSKVQAEEQRAAAMKKQFASALDIAMIIPEDQERLIRLMARVETFKQSVRGTNLVKKIKKNWLIAAVFGGGLLGLLTLYFRSAAPSKLASLEHEPPYRRPRPKKKAKAKTKRRARAKPRKKAAKKRKKKARRFRVSVAEVS